MRRKETRFKREPSPCEPLCVGGMEMGCEGGGTRKVVYDFGAEFLAQLRVGVVFNNCALGCVVCCIVAHLSFAIVAWWSVDIIVTSSVDGWAG